MPNAKSLDSILADGERLGQVWAENSKFSMGDLTLDEFKAELTKLRTLRQARDATRVKLSKETDDTSDQQKLVESLIARGRSGMKAIFGPDSAQYGQVGGTRLSERKPRAAKKTKSAQP